MMLCDKCNRGWHTFCLNPTVSKNIKVFKCPMCMPTHRTRKVPQGLPMPKSTAPVIRIILRKRKQSAGGTRSLAEPIKEPATPTRWSCRTSVDEVLHRRCLNYNNQQVVQLSTTPSEPATLWEKIHYLGNLDEVGNNM
jgi:hypothetical protein